MDKKDLFIVTVASALMMAAAFGGIKIYMTSEHYVSSSIERITNK